ncbi:hypothetical protein AA0114_g12238 [Alternaria tenuissima]|uniref:Uncharacterized protein n=1 Tax=Alternaria tenuissima TaxID=119927 RepID=A0A4Q4LZM9_9PLEO|nr:hypothetical protein AA0114_g12238 [Alternaria tenuissima]
MNTTTENSAAAFSKVADQETNNLHLYTDDLRLYNDDLRLYNDDLRLYNDDLHLYNDDFLNRLQALAKFRDRVHKTHQQVHVPELNRRLQPDPHLPLPGEDASPHSPEASHDSCRGRGRGRGGAASKVVDGAASRVVDEVLATEMARAVVGLERLLERRRRWLVRYTATLIG